MKYSVILSGALLSAAVLAACGGSHGLSSPTSVLPQGFAPLSGSGSEHVLYSFQGGNDGQAPESPVTYVGGALYGATVFGGGSVCAGTSSLPGCGTIYELTPPSSGYKYKESVLRAYAANGADGDLPAAALVEVGDKLFSTTSWGGGRGQAFLANCALFNGCGTIFSIDPSNTHYHVLDRLSGRDGFNMQPGIVAEGDTLYGASLGGGIHGCIMGEHNGNGCGIVYKMAKSGERTLLYKFKGGQDGEAPINGPVAVGKMLYGATWFGGGKGMCGSPSGLSGCGTIYEINTWGTGYKVLYRFGSAMDGTNPLNVIDVNGALYGTTNFGGSSACTNSSFPSGCGIVFKFDLSSKRFSVLYRFQGASDGASPNSLISAENGTLYGTTTAGGGSGCGGSGCGTVFELGTTGTKNYGVVYRFQGGTDGAAPAAGVIDVSGTLYGTTSAGGGYGCGGGGCGTVYAVIP